MENIRDWCISRQLWWGHRIPVWYCQDCEELICSKEVPQHCTKCESSRLVQDPDVLDTWFSSGLWPFSTLGWPDETIDLESYYPTSVLVTGRDIIFFWVARMIFSGIEFMPDVPFREVFIHGLVLDAQGRKMSKSLGNGIDPIEVIDEYGADTLRFMLITGNTPGNDLRFQTERLESTRNFTNKIWNASRFAIMNLQDYNQSYRPQNLALADRWIRSRFNRAAKDVTRNMERYDLGEAARLLYDFLWDDLCDWYIELIKPRLYGKESEESKRTAQYILATTLRQTLELLHPFMPFITEEIWQLLPHKGETIMLAAWFAGDEVELDEQTEHRMNTIMETIRAIRNLRSEMNVAPGKKAEVILMPLNEEMLDIFRVGEEHIINLGSISKLTILSDEASKPDQAVAAVISGAEIYLPLRGLIDIEKELARLGKELENYAKEIARLEGKLNNAGFINKAPVDVVEKEKEKLSDYQAKKDAVAARIESLK
jgi:valyl-tRNA synthetase